MMSCFSGLFKQGLFKQRESQLQHEREGVQNVPKPEDDLQESLKERQLGDRVKELQEHLKESQQQLEQERQKRMDSEEQAEFARQRSEEMQKRYEDAKVQSSAVQKPAGTLSSLSSLAHVCLSRQEERELEMMLQLKEVQEELSASRAAVHKLQAQREQLEAQAELHASPRTSREVSLDMPEPPFKKSVSYTKTETPARQRDMKTEIQQLLQDLQISQENVDLEEEMRKQAEHDTMYHEANAISFELKMSADKGLSRKVDALLKSNIGQSKSIAASLTRAFRGKSPAKNQELRASIQSCHSELQAEERRASVEQAAHDAALRKLADMGAWTPRSKDTDTEKFRACLLEGNSTPRTEGKVNSFAFQVETIHGC